MKSLDFCFKNCHGIKYLSDNFYFSKHYQNQEKDVNYNTILIYAPNGTMKTSFTNTFRDLCADGCPKNNWCDLDPVYKVSLELNNEKVPLYSSEDFKKYFLVIESLKEDYDLTEYNDLIVNKKCRDQFDKITKEIIVKKDNLIKLLKNLSKIKVPKNNNVEDIIEKEFQNVFKNEDNILKILLSIEDDLKDNKDMDVNIKYDLLFGKNVQDALNDELVKESIDEYIKSLDKLLDKSPIYIKDKFNNTQLKNLMNSIKKNNLFNAKHKIKFNRIGTPVSNLKELKNLIEKENDKIFNNEELKNKFNDIDKKLSKNKDLIEFKKFLSDNPFFIKRLHEESFLQLKKEYWLSILNQEKDSYYELIDLYNEKAPDLEKIRKQSNKENTEWGNVTDLFNKRFFLDFELELTNKNNVILNDKVPTFKFKSKDYPGKSITWEELKKFYSEGQKRALYLLNVLYEIELRKKVDEDTILILDDIADSFDYENKYAIIQYLKELSNDDKFPMIILTHNFDFYRTLKSRLNICTENTYYAVKEEYQINIKSFNIEQNTKNIFKALKNKIESGSVNALIAIIPFIRNLTELLEDSDDNLNYKEVYVNLTKILHYKDDGKNLTLNDFTDVFKKFRINKEKIKIDNKPYNGTIYNLIFKQADELSGKKIKEINLENKIVMSMAIRLLADKFMLSKLSLKSENITTNQTTQLYDIYTKKYGKDTPESKILERVNLMTPENIHINSFMYEPLIDMGDKHLKTLYEDIKKLSENTH
ncbi:hypothetical protein ACA135_05865 [Methanobrevibacter acididurans]|uniref:hypothetical protein n=1 Tax=Methanobrevibacter acididurans TaxID=120963 RepID=UPI0038FD0154